MATPEEIQLQDLRRNIYQSRWLFTKSYYAKWGLKLLTFLGIALPVLTGGIVMSFYHARQQGEWSTYEHLIDASAFLSVILVLATVWSLVDDWAGRAQVNDRYRDQINKLYEEATILKASDLTPTVMSDYNRKAYEIGLAGDNFRDVSEKQKEKARGAALKRYPTL